MKARIITLAALLTTAVGCASTYREEDPGRACLVGDAADVARVTDGAASTSLEADEAATVVVVVEECVSGSVRWLEKTCTAELSGTTLEIAAFAKSRTPTSVTLDCQFVTVECATPPLPAGEYTLTYGDASETIQVPFDGPMACLTP